MAAKVDYSMNEIRDEVHQLVEKGIIDRHQHICMLCEFIPPREWICVEAELANNDYDLRDRICDLLCHDEWQDD